MTSHSTLTEGLASSKHKRNTAPALFRALNAEKPLEPSARHFLFDVDAILLGRSEQRTCERAREGDVRVLRLGFPDRWMSSRHARMTRVMQAWMVEDTQSKNGVRVNGKAIQQAQVLDGDVLELGRTFLVFRASQPIPGHVPPDFESDRAGLTGDLVTLQPELATQFALLERIAHSNVTIALFGASGTGKEVVGRAIHALSGRSGPFVPVNCGALPENLVESELFGHRKGSFSGATEDRAGLVRAAHGGTLFLDEIGDLPLEAQPALLRVLQERQVTPVGATSPIPVDVRVVSATHRYLGPMIDRGEFRADLRARLSGFEFNLPTLAERREDLGILVRALLERVAGPRANSVELHHEAARALLLYDWPLNIRELEKAIEAAVVLAGDGPVLLEHLPAAVREPKTKAKGQPRVDAADDDQRRAQLEALLREHGGNVSSVARAMGKARMQIQRWMAKYSLDPSEFKH